MKNTRVLMLLVAFAVGCVAHAVLSVPPARAQNTARWEHWCADFEGKPSNEQLEKPGAEGWELVSVAFRPPVVSNGSSVGGGATLACFKRPR